jgi:hypothetical protein
VMQHLPLAARDQQMIHARPGLLASSRRFRPLHPIPIHHHLAFLCVDYHPYIAPRTCHGSRGSIRKGEFKFDKLALALPPGSSECDRCEAVTACVSFASW